MADKVETPQWFDKVYNRDRNFWLAVGAMLQLMVKGGLPVPSDRRREFTPDDPETLGVYVMDLADAGITTQDIAADGHAVRQGLRWFPSSGELVAAMRALKDRREPAGYILDPVFVFERGHVCLASRKAALAQGLTFYDSQMDCERANGLRPPQRALPQGGGMKALMASIDAIAAKATGWNKLPERFPARAKLLAAGIQTTGQLRRGGLPDSLTEDEAEEVQAALEAEYIIRNGMTPEKRAEVDAELAELGAKLAASKSKAS